MIRIDGVDNQKNSLEAKRRMSYVPDNPDLFERSRGRKYLWKFMGDDVASLRVAAGSGSRALIRRF